jgi:MFS superfamily sulfate permease-like transporter
VDVTAADMLSELDDELRQARIELAFAEMKDPVKDKLRRFGLFERFGEDHFFMTIGQAVDAYVEASGIEWVDWEERT